jgi:MFS family permease
MPVLGIGEAYTSYNPTAGTDGTFSPVGWLSEPVREITGYLQEGQSIIGILAPFLAVVVLGIVLVARRERKKGRRQPLLFWLATVAGLAFLGGASITFVQMFRVFRVTGAHSINIFPLVFAVAGIILGILALRTARSPSPGSIYNRMFLMAIGFFGLMFWSGLLIGPILLFGAAAVPITIGILSWPAVPGK